MTWDRRYSICRVGSQDSTDPQNRKPWQSPKSDSRQRKLDERQMFVLVGSWRVPDGRCVSPLVYRHRHVVRHLYAKALLVIGRPARCRDLDDPGIVDRAKRGIEVGVLPDGDQLRAADCVGPDCVCNVDRIPDRWQLAVGAGFTPIRPGNIIDLLLQLPVWHRPSP